MNGKFTPLTKKGKSAVTGKDTTLCMKHGNAECVRLLGNCSVCSTNDEVWLRLAEFEAFGLHPHEVKYFLSTCHGADVVEEVHHKKVREE